MLSMPEKVEKKMERGKADMRKNHSPSLRIAEIIYGTKELTKCMESVIKIHTDI